MTNIEEQVNRPDNSKTGVEAVRYLLEIRQSDKVQDYFRTKQRRIPIMQIDREKTIQITSNDNRPIIFKRNPGLTYIHDNEHDKLVRVKEDGSYQYKIYHGEDDFDGEIISSNLGNFGSIEALKKHVTGCLDFYLKLPCSRSLPSAEYGV